MSKIIHSVLFLISLTCVLITSISDDYDIKSTVGCCMFTLLFYMMSQEKEKNE